MGTERAERGKRKEESGKRKEERGEGSLKIAELLIHLSTCISF
jgi:hypothetical protein